MCTIADKRNDTLHTFPDFSSAYKTLRRSNGTENEQNKRKTSNFSVQTLNVVLSYLLSPTINSSQAVLNLNYLKRNKFLNNQLSMSTKLK
jgi:hypothetical protein